MSPKLSPATGTRFRRPCGMRSGPESPGTARRVERRWTWWPCLACAGIRFLSTRSWVTPRRRSTKRCEPAAWWWSPDLCASGTTWRGAPSPRMSRRCAPSPCIERSCGDCRRIPISQGAAHSRTTPMARASTRQHCPQPSRRPAREALGAHRDAVSQYERALRVRVKRRSTRRSSDAPVTALPDRAQR